MLRGGGGGGARNSSEGRAMELTAATKILFLLELYSCMTPPFANARILAGVQRNPAGETY